jgi:hypothetical protein
MPLTSEQVAVENQVLRLTCISYGTMTSIAKKAGCFDGNLFEYNVLDELFASWRNFVRENICMSYSCWQDAWLGYVSALTLPEEKMAS